MYKLTNALPCGERAKVLKTDMDRRLVSSLLSLLGVAERSFACDFPDARIALEHLRTSIATGVLLAEYAYALHHRLRSEMEAQNAEAVYLAISKIPTIKFFRDEHHSRITAMECECFSSFAESLVFETISSEYNNTYEYSFDGKKPESQNFQQTKSVLDEVLRRIRYLDQPTLEEFRFYVANLSLFRSGFINAGTTFQAFGRLYLACLRTDQDWTTYLEHVVHETAHHHLFAVWSQHSMIENEADGFYKSPLRIEPRPLSGIFHAMFVLGRTIRAINIFKQSEYAKEVSTMRTQYNNAKNPASFERKFVDAATVIETHAILTPIGQAIFASTREMVSL